MIYVDLLRNACLHRCRVLHSAFIQLANTEEIQDGTSNGTLGEVFIRYAMLLLLETWSHPLCAGVTMCSTS
jgi:hypothetical protein